MNNKVNQGMLNRKLSIDFELYTDNDAEFKSELIDHIIDNLHELLQSYRLSVDQKDSGSFHKACHKVKTTLVMLEDDELNALVEDLKKFPPAIERTFSLDNIGAAIIDSLMFEKNKS